MNANPYAPPTAHVEDVLAGPLTGTGDEAAPPFFAVSLVKLAVMSVCTFGMYELFWFYKNWQRIRARDGSDIKPFWRAFFAVLYCYSCFRHIREHGEAMGLKSPIAAGALATGWILATLTYKLPDPYWLLTLSAIVFVLPVQAYVNRINAVAASSHDPNNRFRGWNWVAVVLGGGLLLLALVGMLTPQQ